MRWKKKRGSLMHQKHERERSRARILPGFGSFAAIQPTDTRRFEDPSEPRVTLTQQFETGSSFRH